MNRSSSVVLMAVALVAAACGSTAANSTPATSSTTSPGTRPTGSSTATGSASTTSATPTMTSPTTTAAASAPSEDGDLVASPDPGAGTTATTEPAHPAAFADGHWDVTYAVDYAVSGTAQTTSVDGHTVLQGAGTLEIEHGKVVGGTMTAAGRSAGTVASPVADATSDGTLTITGTLDGDAVAPKLHASSGFSGSVTANGTTTAVNTTFGVFTGSGVRLVIASASDALVTGDWTADLATTDQALGLSSSTMGSFTAVRTDRCAGTGATVPLWPDRIAPGTLEAPTHVQLDVDAGITQDRGLQTQLTSAVLQWNSALAEAKVGIVLDLGSPVGGASGTTPVVRVGVDGPSFSGLHDQDGHPFEPVEPVWGAVTEWLRWTKDGAHLDTSEAMIRLNGHIEQTKLGNSTWPELAAQHPWFVRETFVHELGHIIGLGDQRSDPSSVMYYQSASLADGPGAARSFDCADVRALTALLGG